MTTSEQKPSFEAQELETAFAMTLAELLEVQAVDLDSHFFETLGADSLMMARFCARVRKQGTLPPVSMKEVYAHSTIRRLAHALAHTQKAKASLPPIETTPTKTGEYFLCGTLQLIFYLASSYIVVFAVIEGFQWFMGDSQGLESYLRFVAFCASGAVIVAAVPIIAKWLLIGRFKPGSLRIWSLAYFRFWVVKFLIRTNPVTILLIGSPLYAFYLRLLGAKVGARVLILSREVPVCVDLLSIGSGTVIRRDASFLCYRALAGRIEMGTVTLGSDVWVGEASVLDINVAMGDNAELGHSSSLHSGQRVPAGQSWHGSPAQPTTTHYRSQASLVCGPWRRAFYGAITLFSILFVVAPLSEASLLIGTQLATETAPGVLWFDALALSLLFFVGPILLAFLAVGIVVRLLGLFLKPDTPYPLYGFHYTAHRAIVELCRLRFLVLVFGDSSYIVHFLQCVGFRLSPVVQTGSNFGIEVKTTNPFLTSVGSGSMVADGFNVINDAFSNTAFLVSHAKIGKNNFLGNVSNYPSGAKTGDNCLLATKAMVPLEGPVRENIGLLGSPPFEIPRTVERDKSFDHLRHGEALKKGLAAKNRFNLRTIALLLFTRWVGLFLVVLIDLFAVAYFYDVLAHLVMALLFALSAVVGGVYYSLIERLIEQFSPPPPAICSIYDKRFWWVERVWKLRPVHFFNLFNGTPFKIPFWRLVGVRMGRKVFDDGVHISEPLLTTIGDDCVLNHKSCIQAHSEEDGTFKSGPSGLGRGCTLGVGTFVNYSVTMRDGATLMPDSFLMKGEEVPEGAQWGGNPARGM